MIFGKVCLAKVLIFPINWVVIGYLVLVGVQIMDALNSARFALGSSRFIAIIVDQGSGLICLGRFRC